MTEENSEQREVIQEESPLSAELDAEIEALGDDEELNFDDKLPTDDNLSAKLDKEFEEDEVEEVETEEPPEKSEAELAAEIIKESEPKPKKKTKEEGLIDAITAQRASSREKDKAIASLTEQLATATKPKVEPVKKIPEVSPIELYAKKEGFESVDDPDFSPSYSEIKKQQRWERAQDAKTVTEQTAADAGNALQASCTAAFKEMTVEKMGEGLDLGTIYDMGNKYLRPGDEMNVRTGGTGQVLYDECFAAIQRSGTQAEKKLLALQIKAQNEKTTASEEPKPKDPKEPKPKPKPKTDESKPAERFGDERNNRLTDFVFG